MKDFIQKHFTGANNWLGWVGVICIQGATLPPMVDRLLNPETAVLPPLLMVLMVWLGLFLYLVRAVRQGDAVYIVSNALGFLLNSILLACIVFPS
jgi:hypothetical protein